MNRASSTPTTRRLPAAVALVLAAAVGRVDAGVNFFAGQAFYQHTYASGGSSTQQTANFADISSEANLSSVSFTLNSNNVPLSGGGATTGKARVGYIANSTTASISIKPGSGISQSDPAGTNAFSETRIDIKDSGGTPFKWDATSPGFGPPSTRYVSFTVAGTIGAGGFARCYINLAWYKNSVSGANSLGGVTLDTGTLTTAGVFSKTLTASSSLSGSTLTTGTDILMIGTILFQANNHASPSDLFPVDSALGFSNSGPVITFVGQPGPVLDWLQPINWETNNAISQPPQEIGDRAYLPNDMGIPRLITLDTPIHLGVLESNGSTETQIQDTGMGRLLLQNLGAARAMVWQRNINGDASLILNLPVILNSTQTEFLNDSSNPIVVATGMDSSSQSGGVFYKTGQGSVHLGGVQLHPNGMTFAVEQGELRFNSDVGFGTGTQTSAIHAGTAGMVGTAVLAAPLKLGVLHAGPRGLIQSQAAGKVASATRSLSIDTLEPGLAQFDLFDDGLVVRVDAGQPSPIVDLATLIQSGYAGGAWTGEGIVSSLAALPASGAGVGYSPMSLVQGGPGSFMGQATDSDDIAIRYTLLGDANLNGSVTIADFGRLAANFNTAAGWAGGDSNYDLLVNLTDFALLASNFNRSLPSEPPRSTVPEPTGLLVSAGAGLAILRRRSRRA